MQKAQLAAALVATLGFALHGTAYAANNNSGMNVTEADKSVKVAKDEGSPSENSCSSNLGRGSKSKDASCSKGAASTDKAASKSTKKSKKSSKSTKKDDSSSSGSSDSSSGSSSGK